MHVLDGAVAIPGLYPLGSALEAEHLTDHLVMGSLAAGGATIHVRSTDVRLGDDTASQFVALANLVNARIDTIQAAFDGHTHVETGGTTNVPQAPIGPLASVACTKVKAL
jgi:Flp pilus assembly CpaF family ATPase